MEYSECNNAYNELLNCDFFSLHPESISDEEIKNFINRPWNFREKFNSFFRIYTIGNCYERGFGERIELIEKTTGNIIYKDTHEFTDNHLFCGYIGHEKSQGLKDYSAKLDNNTIYIEELAKLKGKSFLCSHCWPTVYPRTDRVRSNPCFYSIPKINTAVFCRNKLLEAQYFLLSHYRENPFLILGWRPYNDFSKETVLMVQIMSKHYRTQMDNRLSEIKSAIMKLGNTIQPYLF